MPGTEMQWLEIERSLRVVVDDLTGLAEDFRLIGTQSSARIIEGATLTLARLADHARYEAQAAATREAKLAKAAAPE